MTVSQIFDTGTLPPISTVCKVPSISDFISKQQEKYVVHLIRMENDLIAKRMLLSADKNKQTW